VRARSARPRRLALLLALAAPPALAAPAPAPAATTEEPAPAAGAPHADPNLLPLSSGFRLGLMLDLHGTFTGLSLGLGGIDAYRLRGVSVGLLGVGHHGVTGLTLAGGVIGGEGHLSGLSAAGLGIIQLGGVRGVGVAGVGILGMDDNVGLLAAPVLLLGEFRGVALGAAVRVGRASGVVVAPAILSAGIDADPGGGFTGLSLSAVNWIDGEQRGVSVGLVNYAASLHGVQIGVVNYAANNRPGLRLLPLVNAHFD
jgi:hypothetical protein